MFDHFISSATCAEACVLKILFVFGFYFGKFDL